MRSKKFLLSGIAAILVFLISSKLLFSVDLLPASKKEENSQTNTPELLVEKKDSPQIEDNKKNTSDDNPAQKNAPTALVTAAPGITEKKESASKDSVTPKQSSPQLNPSDDTASKEASQKKTGTKKKAVKAKKDTSLYTNITYGRIGNVDSKHADIAISKAKPYVNIRKSPGTDSAVLGKLYKGSAAAILKTKGKWVLIKSGTVKGYIKTEYLNTKLKKEEIIKKYGILKAVVNTDGLRVREKKDKKSRILTVIYSNESYKALGVNKNWVKIRIEDDHLTGFVAKEFVKFKVNYKQAVSLEEEKALLRLKQKKKAVKQALSMPVRNYSLEDLKLLACLVHAESGNQPYEGKLAVANVVLNRVEASSYPDSIKSVIYQSGQFSVVNSGSLSKQLSNYNNYNSISQKLSIEAAKSALEGKNNIGNCLYFNRYSKSSLAYHPYGIRIEGHLFW